MIATLTGIYSDFNFLTRMLNTSILVCFLFLLKCSWSIILCLFLLYSKVIKIHTCTHTHIYAYVFSCFSCVWLFATLWTVAHQAPQSMGFSCKNTEVGCHALLQGIFLIQGSTPHLPCLLHCTQILSHWTILFYITFPLRFISGHWYNSLCYTVRFCCLSILYVIVYIY